MIEVCQIGYTEISISRSPPSTAESTPDKHLRSHLHIIHFALVKSVQMDGWVAGDGWMDRSNDDDRRSDVITSNWFIIWRNDRVICLTIDLLFINVNLRIYCIRRLDRLLHSPLANTFFMLFRCVVQFQRLWRNWNWHSSRLRLIPFIITSSNRVLLRQMSCKLSLWLANADEEDCWEWWWWCGWCCCCCCCSLLRLHTRTGSRMTLLPSTLKVNK